MALKFSKDLKAMVNKSINDYKVERFLIIGRLICRLEKKKTFD
jgi:hypothetical protein